MVWNKESSKVRISKEAKAKLDEYIRTTGLNSSALLDHFLSISSDQPSLSTPVSPPAALDSPIKKVRKEQPPQGLIDAFIMDVWGVTKLRLIPDLRIDQIPSELNLNEWTAEVMKRELALTAELDKLPQSISRKTIMDETYKALTDKGWNTIYPNWAKTKRENHGDFQRLIDKRLSALCVNLYLSRSRGLYSQNNLFLRQVDLIAGIIELIPQQNLKITRLLKRESYQSDTWQEYQNRH